MGSLKNGQQLKVFLSVSFDENSSLSIKTKVVFAYLHAVVSTTAHYSLLIGVTSYSLGKA